MSAKTYENILVDAPQDGVGLVRLNRPKALNALSKALMTELVEVLEAHDFTVTLPRTKEDAVAAIRGGSFDIAILSYTLPDKTVEELTELIREYCPECPLIAISDTGRVDRRIGPDEVVIADEGPAALIAALRRAIKSN